VRFVQGDAQTLEGISGAFDAVVGRLVLMYLPDPVEAIRRAARLVRPDGLVCLHEGDMTYDWAFPMTPLWTQMRGWMVEALTRTGVATRMGLSLHSTFVAAGLPAPELRLECALGAGEQARAWGWANVMRGLLPLLERLEIATAADLEPDSLEDRLEAELREVDGIVVWPPMVGAWSRVPG
jgi:SAM-dependent methyltransferase